MTLEIQQAEQGALLEVWGDTVKGAHLVWSIAIGCTVSLGAFLLATKLLTGFEASPDVARTHAMLVGLGGCLLSGLICAKLFPPKRTVVDHAADPAWRDEVLGQLIAETGSDVSTSNLSPAAIKELKELDLYEVFAERERNATPDVEGRAVAGGTDGQVGASGNIQGKAAQ